MQLFLILFSAILLFASDITGHEIVFPIEDCAGIFNGDFAPCIHALTKKGLQWHQWTGNTRDERCGFPCVSQLKGRFLKWKWMWDARFQCETKAPGIVGAATKHSRNGAIEWAMIDFLQKAVAAGHIQSGDTSCAEMKN